MKTPKEFDYDLWTEEGRNMVRVKRTGEVCQVDDITMRLLRAEEKRLRRSMQGAPVPGSDATEPVLSLDYMSADEDGDSTSAWLEDPHDFTIAIATEALSKEFASTLTSREQEVYSYTLPEKTVLEGDCLGVLTIPAIGLEMKVYEAEDEMEAMLKGGAHYKDTSAWDGNVGISAHNSGVPDCASFGNLQKLRKGDAIFYKTSLGERQYKVETILEISDEDWSWLGRTADNRITLTTCVTGKPDKRFLVQAVQG